MQTTMTDCTKFVDMLHNVPWEDGLPEDIVQGEWSALCKKCETKGLYST